jgi:hypothetical protein
MHAPGAKTLAAKQPRPVVSPAATAAGEDRDGGMPDAEGTGGLHLGGGSSEAAGEGADDIMRMRLAARAMPWSCGSGGFFLWLAPVQN